MNMPILTEQQKQELIESCTAEMEGDDYCLKYFTVTGHDKILAQIVLAALTVPIRGYIDLGTPEDEVNVLTQNKILETDVAIYTAPPVPALRPIQLNKGALMISAYATDPMNEDPVLCLSKDGVIDAIRAAGYEVKE